MEEPRSPIEVGALIDHPDVSAVAGALREEWRVDAEELAADAARAWAHRRRLIDALIELVHRGDSVRLSAGPHEWTGTLIAAVNDLATLAAPTGHVDVNLNTPLVVSITQRSRGGGRRADRATRSFRARLYEHEMEGHAVTAGTTTAVETVTGTMGVGADYVTLRDADGCETLIPIAQLAFVTRRVD